MKKLVASMALGLLCLSQASADTQNSFMSLTREERFWWINGSVMTLASYVSSTNEVKAKCISGWYFQDRAGRQRLIEASLAQNPGELPTTVLFAHLTRACGSLFAT